MSTIPKYTPSGRINELRELPEADRIAYHHGRALGDCQVKVYASRKALEVFLKNAGGWNALVKTPTHPNMLVHPAFQRPL
jgi:hypothetical protein